MFNINILKRRMSFSFYKYFICMCFILSGIFIASYAYNIDFSFSKQGSGYLINAFVKVALLALFVRYLCTGMLRFITAPVLLIYSGICLGTFLMFILYNFPLYKFLLTVFPCAFKIAGVMLLLSSCFDFDKFQEKSVSLYTGVILCFLGELLLCLLV